jgi:hypothetical protein
MHGSLRRGRSGRCKGWQSCGGKTHAAESKKIAARGIEGFHSDAMLAEPDNNLEIVDQTKIRSLRPAHLKKELNTDGHQQAPI